MFCSRCGKTLMPEDKQCPHCGTPVGESRFEGTPYTSAQPHILPDTPAGQASAAYTRTTYTTMSDEQQQEGAVDSRITYRPVYDEASAPKDIRKDMRAVIDGGDAQEDKPLPPVEDLPEDVQNTLNAVDEELKMENMDTSELRTRPIESTGRAGISSEVEDYIQKLEATQNRRAARKRRAIDDREDNYATPQEEVVYDDTQVAPDREQSEVFEDIDEEEFDEIRYGRTIGVKDILRVAGIMVLAAALIVGGVLWFRHIRSGNNGSKIEGVTQSLYASGLEQIKANRSDTYINELVNLYRSDGVLALTERVTSDAAAFDGMMPEEPAVNDALYVSALKNIESNIGNAVLMDATEADSVAGDSGQDSTSRWAIVDQAIAQVEAATTAQELTAVVNGERVTVAASPTPTPTPEPEVTYATLTKGDKSDAVLELQNRLFELGFLLDDRDGAYGSKTQTAVKLFQQAAGLEATGIADNETQKRLYAEDAPRTEYAQATPTPAAPADGGASEEAAAAAAASGGYTTLQKGDKNDQVKTLKARLYELGFMAEESKGGSFGSKTKAAVEAFQKAAGLDVTGVADEATQELLYSDSAPHA
ncbi:MAG: peptidoglycan-binding protein [Clostridia bacterium]|nr:peptidoglycan-binding protein [Clostridia bacterium]